MALTCIHDNHPIIKICVATQKKYWMPDDSAYFSLLVGAFRTDKRETGWIRDDTGDNISSKNGSFCELTGLYWIWKSLDADIYGLCHYRRYFGAPASFLYRVMAAKRDRILPAVQIESILKDCDIILPKKRHYWIETRESQYAHAHHIEDLRCVEQILSEKYPEYLPDWKWMLGTRSGHICNMFIMRRELLDAYCTWLFDILFEAERRLDISSYSDKDRRVFGYLGERLLDVWIRKNGLRYTEVPMISLEKQHWLKKGCAFLKRKVTGCNLSHSRDNVRTDA